MRYISLLSLIFLFPLTNIHAQNKLLSYPEVLRYFYSHYGHNNGDHTAAVVFAKKKDGWYTDVVNQVNNDSLIKEQLFWSAKTGNYQLLEGFEKPADQKETENTIDSLLNGYNLNYLYYDYERIPCYGYVGWDKDMIKEFGEGNRNMNDSLLEGLARTYSYYANRFLWYQSGVNYTGDDTLQKPLGNMELPSPQRIAKATQNMDIAIKLFEWLAIANPDYMTLIGSARGKVFNERMNAYMQLQMAGYEQKAMEYLHAIKPDKDVENIAYDYLNSCPPNSILFAYGDNDTFPLWYVQEKYNFRRDVAVLNFNMLGLQQYCAYLKRKKIVSFTTNISGHNDPYSYYFFYTKQNGYNEDSKMDVTELVKIIDTKKFIDTAASNAYKTYISYPCKKFYISVDPERFKKISSLAGQPNKISITIEGDYFAFDQLMQLDIINHNLYTRPACFTFRPPYLDPKDLPGSGCVFRLMPVNDLVTSRKIDVRETEKFLSNKFIPLKGGVYSSSVPNIVYPMFIRLANYYTENKMKTEAKKWLNKCVAYYPEGMPFSIDLAYISYNLLQSGEESKGINMLEDFTQKVWDYYKHPTAIMYLSRGYAKELIDFAVAALRASGSTSDKIDLIESKMNEEE